MRSLIVVAAVPAVISLSSLVAAQVTVSSGVVDVSAITVSGRQGSVDNDTDDPAPLNGTSGNLLLSVLASAGPVAAGELPTLPGTDGVVSAQATAQLQFTPSGNDLTIFGLAFTNNEFESMDGGSYFGSALALFETEFTITEPTTYIISGQTLWDNQDTSSSVRLVGLATGIQFLRVVGSNGQFSQVGVLMPDTYELRGSANVAETPIPPSGGFEEFGTVDVTLELIVPCVGDVNGDNAVGLSDLARLLSNFGTAGGATLAEGDLDDDGDVDLNDLSRLLANFGASC